MFQPDQGQMTEPPDEERSKRGELDISGDLGEDSVSRQQVEPNEEDQGQQGSEANVTTLDDELEKVKRTLKITTERKRDMSLWFPMQTTDLMGP